VLTGQRRLSDADLAAHARGSGFLTRVETLIGTPDQPGSLTARLAQFEAALVAAANAPHSQAHLSAGVQAAVALSDQINAISDGIQAERLQADGDIARGVATVNTALDQLADLNSRIRKGFGGGRDVSSLLDAQARLVDSIAPMIPMQTRRDATGALQIYSRDGQVLLDGRASVLGFAPVSVMAPDMAVDNSALSSLSINGRPVTMTGPQAALRGGDLAAMFELRDVGAVNAQAQIDAVARDLTTRFDAPALDPSKPPGAAGLFSDAGLAAAPVTETGLAARLRVNAAVLPEDGGAVWRLRDGIGAATEGPIGQAGFLNAQIGALSALSATASGGFSTAARSFAGLVSDHLTLNGLARQAAETNQSHVAASHGALRQEELAKGVDTDAEMQRLLQIEKTFSANARVISAAEDMLDELMRLGR
jgi:flagellar hook-associated protein 1 FlgK